MSGKVLNPFTGRLDYTGVITSATAPSTSLGWLDTSGSPTVNLKYYIDGAWYTFGTATISTDNYLLWEDGSAVLWEDGSKVIYG